MSYVDFDETLIGEAPCEFCGESYPLYLLIEHQECELHFAELDIRRSTEFFCEKSGKRAIIQMERPRLNDGAIPAVFEGCPEYLSTHKVSREDPETKKRRIEYSQLHLVIEQRKKSFDNHLQKFKIDSISDLEHKICLIDIPDGFNSTTHLNDDLDFLEDVNFPGVVVNETPITEPKKIDDAVQQLGSSSEVKEVTPVQAPKPPNQITAIKPDVKNSVNQAQPLKTSKSFTETKKIPQKNYRSEIEELTTEKGEKLLVYGANIDPVEDLESEKSSYNKPNNPLLSNVTKEEDVIDINSLSDDDSEESLEEFWKRARDFLKRNRSKT